MTYPEVRVLQGCCLETLKRLESESVHCVVTSPPYHGLRDYGTGRWEGGSGECDHLKGGRKPVFHQGRQGNAHGTPFGAGQIDQNMLYRDTCGKCGARRVDQQIGLEASVGEHIAKLVEVFREVRRVLRPEGVIFVNYGDCYQNKQLMGMPWRLAFALQADGWILRSDIIWAKPNPLPESVQDRPTRSHEYVFLLSRSERYYYDADAVREKALTHQTHFRSGTYTGGNTDNGNGKPGAFHRGEPNPAGRNRRTVWEIPTEPVPWAHFACFPRALVRPCILAGTSAEGCCHACGAPFCRVVEKGELVATGPHPQRKPLMTDRGNGNGLDQGLNRDRDGHLARMAYENKTTGWTHSCSCPAAPPVPCTVLDIFAGSGTVGEVALSLGRSAVLLELNPEYVRLIEKRLSRAQVPLALGI